jgi:hypothetical protein
MPGETIKMTLDEVYNRYDLEHFIRYHYEECCDYNLIIKRLEVEKP